MTPACSFFYSLSRTRRRQYYLYADQFKDHRHIHPTEGASPRAAALSSIYALTGCDTTSRPYGIGKLSAMSKYSDLQHQSSLRKWRQALVICPPNVSHRHLMLLVTTASGCTIKCRHGWAMRWRRQTGVGQ